MRLSSILREIRDLQLDLARLEGRSGLLASPPSGASPRALTAVERRLGRPLPPSFRELYTQHDGFPQIYQGVSLLDAEALAGGDHAEAAQKIVDLGAPYAELIPFGLDSQAETIFALDLGAPHAHGELEVVLWISEIGVRVESFPAFLDLILDMLGSDLEERRREKQVSRRRAVYPRPLPSLARAS